VMKGVKWEGRYEGGRVSKLILNRKNGTEERIDWFFTSLIVTPKSLDSPHDKGKKKPTKEGEGEI